MEAQKGYVKYNYRQIRRNPVSGQVVLQKAHNDVYNVLTALTDELNTMLLGPGIVLGVSHQSAPTMQTRYSAEVHFSGAVICPSPATCIGTNRCTAQVRDFANCVGDAWFYTQLYFETNAVGVTYMYGNLLRCPDHVCDTQPMLELEVIFAEPFPIWMNGTFNDNQYIVKNAATFHPVELIDFTQILRYDLGQGLAPGLLSEGRAQRRIRILGPAYVRRP